MSSSFQNKRFLVIGLGSIGGAIADELVRQGSTVYGLNRTARPSLHPQVTYLIGDVVTREGLHSATTELHQPGLHGVIYSVGHCPPYGFDEAVSKPFIDLSQEKFMEELNLHVLGLHSAAAYFLPCLVPGGHFLTIGSAINRLPAEKLPPWLHVTAYAAAKAAQDRVIAGLRVEPLVRQNRYLIDRIAPAAVDTPFHQGCAHRPPALLPISTVVDEVLLALQSTSYVDKELVAPPPSLTA